jgi:DNA-binding transcriptional LysR family regulator
MMPTALAIQLQPRVQSILQSVDEVLHLGQEFDADSSSRVFRIMASDYAEATLIPPLMQKLQEEAPGVILDVMNPSDVSFHDVEKGKVDLVINRFEQLPQSFHQKSVWVDRFSCLVPANDTFSDSLTLEEYLAAQHVWVSKTGFGVGVGIQPEEVQKLGWVDGSLAELGHKRNIRLFTRNYNVAMRATEQLGLIATLPSLATRLMEGNNKVRVVEPPFTIPPVELKMLWSPLLQHDPGHIWLRSTISGCARAIAENADLG